MLEAIWDALGVRIRLLGRLGIEGDNGVIVEAGDLPGRQGRLALAYLLYHGYPVDRSVLAQLLWGDELPRSWERDLSAVVSKLRAVFVRVGAQDVLAGTAGSYELRIPAGTRVDVEDVTTFLEEAESLMRAGSYAEALGSAYASFELAKRALLPGDESDWLQDRRDELRARYGRAVDVSARGYRALGNMREAVRMATRAIEIEPYRESAYVTLMQIHLDNGDRAEALRVYERCRTRLRDELGVPPGPEAEAAHRGALHADAEPPRPPLPAPMMVAVRRELFGRDDELARLRAAWEGAVDGHQGAVLLAGEPGIGKTRLMAELARDAYTDGGIVLHGRCDSEPLASYQPFGIALRRWVEEASPVALRAHGASRAGDLGAVLPELGTRVGRAGGPGAADRLRLYEAVTGLLRDLARDAPVLLAIDDLHAADRPTLGLLSHLLRSPAQARLLIVATYRNAEPRPDPTVSALVADLRLDGLADEIKVGGLDAGAVSVLVAAESGRPIPLAEAENLRARTDGNPLFLSQLAHAEAGAPLPPGVSDAIARHLRRLPPEALEPLTPAAVLGLEFEFDVLGEIVALDRDLLVDALETAARARVLAHLPGTRRYAFAHPLVRETLYGSLNEPERVLAHARVAAALERVRPADAAPLAHHWLQAGERGPAARHAEAAAEAALAAVAYEDAMSFVDQALELADDDHDRRRLLKLRAVAASATTCAADTAVRYS
jgi:DNA-binding SARP family transcriptional activator